MKHPLSLRTVCAAGLLLLAGQGLAQHRLPPNHYWKKLPNGLEVVVIENAKVPLVTLEIAVKNGAYTEGPEYSGLSHLFEHMFFKANKDYPDQEKFLKRTQELGAIWNGTTDVERVNYYFTIGKDSLNAGLKFMNAAIRFPIYREEDMKKERPVVDGEFQRAESDPGFQLWYESSKYLWGDLLTRKNPIGDHDVINTATPEKMIIIKDKYYHPNNSLLVICGAVKKEDAFAKAEAIFGDWKHAGFDPHQKYPIPAFKPLEKSTFFVKESSIAEAPYIAYDWHGPSFKTDSAGTVAADVFSTILGLNSSQFKQALVDKGLATYATISYSTLSYTGPISIFVIPNPLKLRECHEEVMRQIAKFTDPAYYTDEQLADAKAILIRTKERKMEKPSALASQLTYWWCSTSFEYATDIDSAYQNITREDISKYLARYIAQKPMVAGIIVKPEVNKTENIAGFFKQP